MREIVAKSVHCYKTLHNLVKPKITINSSHDFNQNKTA